MARAKAKRAEQPMSAEAFEPDAIMLRTTDQEGHSYNGFTWPKEEGAIVTCPDWDPTPVCGSGLHGLLDGIGNHGLLNTEQHDRLWWIVGVRRDECVWIEDDKVKVPRAKVIYFGDVAGALSRVAKPMVTEILRSAKGNTATEEKTNAAATGDSGHAAATGYRGHAAATGDRGHAAATGYRGHAAATGYRGHAAATGDRGHAAATGDRGHAAVKGKHAIAVSIGYCGTARAEAGGAIMLAAYDDNWNLVEVFASKVGENGIEPGVTYRLGRDGKPARVEGDAA